MNNDINSILREIAITTFEDLCFIFEDVEAEEDQLDFENGKAAIIEYQGPFNGKIIVKASDTLLGAIAENMLGEDEPTNLQIIDALGEVSNVICGNVLPEISGSKKDIFHLDSPKIYDLENVAEIDERITSEIKLPMEEGSIVIQFIKYED